MKQKQYFLYILVILAIAIGLRFFKFDQVPSGMTWDEAAIGYNGYAVITTKRDEWLQLLPISFQSFGDYKAPFAIYLNGIFTFFLGLELWVIRLPFVMASIVGIASLIWLTYQVALNMGFSKTKAEWWSLLAGGLITLSPWHIHFSRAGFESGMALSLVLLGTAFFYQWLKKNNFLWGIAAITLFVSALYTYHSAKIFVPLLGVFFIFDQKIILWRKKIQAIILSILSILLLSPMVYDSFFRSGAQRAQQTTILAENGSLLSKAMTVGLQLSQHFSPQFLIFGQTTTLRHGDGTWGVLFITSFLLCLVALAWGVSHFKSKSLSDKLMKKWIKLSLVWIMAGLVAPAIGLEIPHANRALMALPGFIWLAVAGFQILVDWVKQTSLNRTVRGSHGEKNIIVVSVIGTFILLHLTLFTAYLDHYYTDFASASTEDFKAGYQEAFDYVLPYEYGADGLTEVDKVIFTSDYGQPYIYALIARKTSPYLYHGGALIKYEFKDVDMGDLSRQNAVIVASGGDDDLPTERADKIIWGSDGSVRFQIFVME